MKLKSLLLSLAVAVAASLTSQAGIVQVMSNLAAGVQAVPHDQTSSNRGYISFGVDAGATGVTFTLDKIRAYVGISQPGGPYSIKMGLYSDNSGMPGTLITESTPVPMNSAGGAQPTDFIFTVDNVLSAGEYYILPTQIGSGLQWYHSSGTGGTLPSEPYTPDVYYVGSQTTATFDTTAVWSDDDNFSFALFGEITGGGGGAVPEPALTSLLCLGGVAFIRRRMKK